MVVTALAALFAAVQSWLLAREVAELRGEVRAAREGLDRHVNAPGLHR